MIIDNNRLIDCENNRLWKSKSNTNTMRRSRSRNEEVLYQNKILKTIPGAVDVKFQNISGTSSFGTKLFMHPRYKCCFRMSILPSKPNCYWLLILWSSINFIEYLGTKYKADFVVIIEWKNNFPTFGIIQQMFSPNKKKYFFCKIIKTILFSRYFYAYEVEISFSNENSILDQLDSLHHFSPCGLSSINQFHYVTIRQAAWFLIF